MRPGWIRWWRYGASECPPYAGWCVYRVLMVAHLFIPAYAGVISSLEKYITPPWPLLPWPSARPALQPRNSLSPSPRQARSWRWTEAGQSKTSVLLAVLIESLLRIRNAYEHQGLWHTRRWPAFDLAPNPNSTIRCLPDLRDYFRLGDHQSDSPLSLQRVSSVL